MVCRSCEGGEGGGTELKGLRSVSGATCVEGGALWGRRFKSGARQGRRLRSAELELRSLHKESRSYDNLTFHPGFGSSHCAGPASIMS